MRVLVTTTAGAGHFGPLLPFIEALRAAGDEVLVAVRAGGVELARSAGLPVWKLADPDLVARDALFASLRGLDAEAANRAVVGEVFAGMDLEAALPGLRLACRRLAPDLVLHESYELGGALAAERCGIPSARALVGLSATEDRLLPHAAAGVSRMRAALGLPPDPNGHCIHDAPRVTLTPLALEDPAAPGPFHTRRFAAPPSRPLRGFWRGDERPLVYVTFGTVAPRMGFFPAVYRAAVDALSALDVRVLMTVGRSCDPAELGPLRAGVRVERWVPQADVMPHTAAIVCHGGFGTVRAGVTAGVPMAVLPLFADQADNARRVADLGAGLVIQSAAEAGAAVQRLLAQPSFTAAAGRVAVDARALPPVSAAAAALRAFAQMPLAA